ncbi:SDR family oxidoreductase [Petrachloros mirabilis]
MPSISSVLITGASGGIGRVISMAFGKAGWFVGLHYHRNKAGAESTLASIAVEGGVGSLYQSDIREFESVRRMVEQFCRDSPPPFALICNAGIAASRLLLKQREEEWSDVIATNLSGTFHCMRAVAPAMIRHGAGSIVVIGSHAGFHGTTGQAAYAASKAGLIGLVKTAALEWGPDNIRVNLVLPGWQNTGLSEGAIHEDDQWPDHALRRPPSIEEVAQTVLYISQLNDVSGQVWNCDSRNL